MNLYGCMGVGHHDYRMAEPAGGRTVLVICSRCGDALRRRIRTEARPDTTSKEVE